MIRAAVVGLGKMGLSHHALLNAHPDVDVVGVCDSSRYVLSVLKEHTGVSTYGDFATLLDNAELDAVLIATPSSSHADMVTAALERNVHVFCEKPLTLAAPDSIRLATAGRDRGLVTQVGYHNRFVGTFREVKALVEAGAIGELIHIAGEAYGPVVLRPQGGTWRSRRVEGGGSLYDYAAHVINLVNWYLGEPVGAGGTSLPRVFSRHVDDGACTTLYFSEGRTAQISVNWSDPSYRRMTTQITIWGTAGRIYADRQECHVYLTDTARIPTGYQPGWNVRFVTDLTEPVWFYLRGEEYSAQIDCFAQQVKGGRSDRPNGFDSAAVTDTALAMIMADAQVGPSTVANSNDSESKSTKSSRRLRLWRRGR